MHSIEMYMLLNRLLPFLYLREVAKLISSVFNAQIFGNGFVHCDPHEANVLLREHPQKRGKPQVVLVDHGLYKRLDPDFQEAYARLWKGIVMADIPNIQSACSQLGVDKMVSKSSHIF
jgi:aarF domain-containing kinase